MTLEIKTATIAPVRHTYANIARRFGEKPATRYQEATYDAQATANFHYRPLWQPQKELNDKHYTALEMADWYALRDPRQFYYGAYVQNRARHMVQIGACRMRPNTTALRASSPIKPAKSRFSKKA